MHDAANSALVGTFWKRELPADGCSSYALDLRGYGQNGPLDISHTRMGDYADDVAARLDQLGSNSIVMG